LEVPLVGLLRITVIAGLEIDGAVPRFWESGRCSWRGFSRSPMTSHADSHYRGINREVVVAKSALLFCAVRATIRSSGSSCDST
jgi:hypothetical protein